MARFNDRGEGPTAQPLHRGQERQVHVKDRDGSVIKTITIHRTDRPYSHDLADAYNANLSDDLKAQGKYWSVATSGELKLGKPRDAIEDDVKQDWARMERERLDFNHRQQFPVTALRDEAA